MSKEFDSSKHLRIHFSLKRENLQYFEIRRVITCIYNLNSYLINSYSYLFYVIMMHVILIL